MRRRPLATAPTIISGFLLFIGGTPGAAPLDPPLLDAAGQDTAKGPEAVLEKATGPAAIPLADFLGATTDGSPPARLRVGDGVVPIQDVVFLRVSPASAASAGPAATVPEPATVLYLRSGSELRGRPVSPAGSQGTAPSPREAKEQKEQKETKKADQDAFRFASAMVGAQPLRVPFEAARGLLVLPPESSRSVSLRSGLQAGTWSVRLRDELLGASPKKDVLVLREEGRMEGILDGLDGDAIHLSTEAAGEVRVPYEKARAVLLAEIEGAAKPERKAASAPGPGVRVALRDGSIVQGSLLGLAGSAATIDVPGLGAVTARLEDVEEIAFLSGRVRYLSDMEPRTVKETLGPAFTDAKPYRRDSNVLREPLRMAGREHRKGLGVHSYSLLEYDLGGQFSRFQALLGLDDSARPRGASTGVEGSVTFRVRLDGKLLLEKPMTWRDAPAPAELDVRGGKTLSLEVDYGGPADVRGILNCALDRADWADARVVQ